MAAVLTISGSAHCANFTQIQGDVLANSGGGFVAATPGSQIQPGDRIMIRQGGNARVAFENGCTVMLNTPGIYIVPAQPTCAAGAISPPSAPIVAAAVGAALGVGILVYQVTKSSSP